jgi:DNA-directed RNA polymerase specialized sigma24 family protein
MHGEEESTSKARRVPDAAADLELVREIRGGSIGAWHQFVDQYSNLILSIVSRYLPRESDDDRRTIYVSILEALFRRRLAQYDGRSSLAGWVAVVARSACLDEIRHRYGRKQVPEWIDGLPPGHREVYRLHFLEGESIERICARLGRVKETGEVWTRADVERALERIDGHLEQGMRNRLAYDLHAREMGAPSGRLLALVDHLLQEARERDRGDGVEAGLDDRETEGRLLQLREFLRRLPVRESEALRLRFGENKTAKEIAGDLGLSGQRNAYTVLDRALRRLKSMFRGVGAVEHSEVRRGEGSAR